MNRLYVSVFITIAFFSGCSLSDRLLRTKKPMVQIDYSFSISEVPSEKKFDLILTSLSMYEICMVNATWPSTVGALDSASTSVFIEVEGNRYPFKEINMGYCGTKDCAIKVARGKEIKANLFFNDFDLPEIFYNMPKKLIFDPRPYWCDKGKWMN